MSSEIAYYIHSSLLLAVIHMQRTATSGVYLVLMCSRKLPALDNGLTNPRVRHLMALPPLSTSTCHGHQIVRSYLFASACTSPTQTCKTGCAEATCLKVVSSSAPGTL